MNFNTPPLVIRLFAAFQRQLDYSLDTAKPFLRTAAIMAVFFQPVFYVVWKYIFPQPYENGMVRLIGALLCLPVIFWERWPERFMKWLPAVYHLAIIYNIPFLFTFFLLRNNVSQIWIFSVLGGAFLLTLLVHWRTGLFMILLGAILLYRSIPDLMNPLGGAGTWQFLIILLFPLSFGAIFNYQIQRYRRVQADFELRLRKITNENSKMMHEQNLLLSHFLSNSIVRRLRLFQKKFDLKTAITLITAQEERYCAIMQADIRSFTKMFDRDAELAVAQLINRCFKETTEVGQDLAVIKPIGDALFMYSDDAPGKKTALLNILSLAIFFVHSVRAINDQLNQQGAEPLNFGIAVHAGPAIYGNLASDTLIDPTIIGLNVNKTARMEELTKAPAMLEEVGANAIILSAEAYELASSLLAGEELRKLKLDDMGIQVRDFEGVEEVYVITESLAERLYERALQQITNQRSLQTETLMNMEVATYHGVQYYFDMQGFGPNTSWTIIIDVSSFSQRAINDYAIRALRDLSFKFNRADQYWLIISTENLPGEYDEIDADALAVKIIRDLEQEKTIAPV